MSERLDLINQYLDAKSAVDKATAHLDAIKFQLKEMGCFEEDGVVVDVAIVTRESLSLKELTKYNPKLVIELREAGIITKSESERLTVKVKQEQERPF